MPPSIRSGILTFTCASQSLRQGCSALQTWAQSDTARGRAATASKSSQSNTGRGEASPKKLHEAILKHLDNAASPVFPRATPAHVELINPGQTMQKMDMTRLRPSRSSGLSTASLQQMSQAWSRQSQSVASVEKESALWKRIGRMWKTGDVYTPKDLGAVEQKKWRDQYNVSDRKRDIFDRIGKSPLLFYRNVALLSEFVTETGAIKHGSITGLRRANQRKLAKAIRRSIALGLMPSTHHHPMLIGKTVGIAASIV